MYGKTLADFPQRQEGFLQVLAAVPLAAMDAGFSACLNSSGEFPVPQEVLAAAERWLLEHRDDETTRQVLSRPDKHTDFQPAGGEAESTIRALVRHRGTITKDEIAQWLEEGKAKAQARYAELVKDPKWREEAARNGVPEYRHTVERNGQSTVPEDPDERRSWARDKAVKGGWIQTREPGDENE